MPYDVLRLSTALKMNSENFLQAFAAMDSMDDTGLPLPMLRMINAPDMPCPFLNPAGCAVYEDRPGTCRAYPLGHAISLVNTNSKEYYFLIREEGCCGLDCGSTFTVTEWLQNQDYEKFNHFNKQYAQLASAIKAEKLRLDSRMANMFFLCLYQPDRFRELIKKMHIFSRLDPGEENKKLLLESGEHVDEMLLEYAFQWLNFIISGFKTAGD